MAIKDFIDRFKSHVEERKTIKRQMEAQDRASNNMAMKKLSANERELLRYKKQEHEENIKSELEFYRQKNKFDAEFMHNPLNTPNVLTGQNDILKQRCIFSDTPNIFRQEEKLFFR